MIPKLRYLSYEERLKQFCLTTLETRRLRGVQIEMLFIEYLKVLVLTEDNKLMETNVYRLYNC